MKHKLKVSDHATLRFIERCCEIDIESFKESLRDKVQHLYDEFGDGKYNVNGDLLVTVKDGCIVTVILP